VAYFLDGKVHASSFAKEGVESLEEKDIAEGIFGGGGGKPAEAAIAGDLSKTFPLVVAGEQYLGASGPLPGNLTRSKSGFVVLASVSAAQGSVGKIQALIVVLGAIALLCVFGATLGTALRFARPLDGIETGVAEVINGNHEYTFETDSPDYEGVANALNVMVARLTGRPDPTDDDGLGNANQGGGSQRWQSEGPLVDGQPTGQVLSIDNQRIANEPEAEYFRRTFEEYVAARKENGESTEGLSLDGFTLKLRENETQLKAKFNVSRVRFKVVTKDKATTLKPIPIP
jgi:hypothetical protein